MPDTDQPAPAPSPALAVVVMGVSGSGKSTLGALLAAALGCSFLEGDTFHDAAAVEKMRAGHPLDDDDRWPWLDRLGRAMGLAARRDGAVVVACSALRRVYRDRLTAAGAVPLRLVLLEAGSGVLHRRLAARTGHYMPPALLPSQLATLEPPGVDEAFVALDATEPPDALCRAAVAWLRGAR